MRRGTAQEVRRFLDRMGPEEAPLSELPPFLLQAARWNPDAGVMRALMERGVSAEARDSFDRTPLMLACRFNDAAVAAALIEGGANVHAVDRNGQNALHFAAAYGDDPDLVAFLLAAGVSADSRDHRSRTPLELALLRQEKDEVFQVLWDSLPDPLPPPSRWTHLLSLLIGTASSPLREDRAFQIFEAGASLKEPDSSGRTLAEQAAATGDPSRIALVEEWQDALQELLYKAIASPASSPEEQEEILRGILNRGARLDRRYRDNFPSEIAAMTGDAAGLAFLLDYAFAQEGLGWPELSPDGDIFLWAASDSSGNLAEVCRVLLAYGASPDVLTPEGSPFLYQILYYSPEILPLLLKGGADPNIRDSDGGTPLIRAVGHNRPEAVALLLSYGADPHARDAEGRDALIYGVQNGASKETLGLVIDAGADLNRGDNYGSSPLLWAAAFDWNSLRVESLIAQGARPDQRDKDGWTALMAALCWGGSPGVVDFLAAQTPDGRLRDGLGRELEELGEVYRRKTGWEPPPEFSPLLERRVYPPDGIPREGLDRALFETAQWGRDPGMVSSLIAAGADIEAREPGGWTPLLVAAAFNDAPMVQAFLEAGADPFARAEQGWSALHVAAWSRDPQIFRLLLQAGIPVDISDRDDWTPLHWAARNQVPREILRLLLDEGADIRRRTEFGESALILLVSGWRRAAPDLVDFLLERGAERDGQNRKGETALMRALGRRFSATARLLLERGADPSLRDERGWNALDYAADKGMMEMSRAISEALSADQE